MKKIAFVGSLLALVFVAVLVLPVTSSSVSAEEGDSGSGNITTAFEVEGMTCGGCEVGVRMTVEKLDGVEDVEASHEQGRAEVTYDPAKVTTDQIIAAVETLGYQAEVETSGA